MHVRMKATRNSPKISPKKNGRAFRYQSSPPYRKMTVFASQVRKIGSHSRNRPKLPETRYPTGWKGHQRKCVRICARNREKPKPKTYAMLEAMSGSRGARSHPRSFDQGAFPKAQPAGPLNFAASKPTS